MTNTQLKLINDLRMRLVEGDVETQEEIRTALASKGHLITQSKISRLLRKIGAIKSKNEAGQIVYHLPHEPAPPTLSSQIASLIIDVIHNETTIIVKTHPGSAQLVARILDFHQQKIQILGTIAGDDTVLITPNSIKKIEMSVDGIRQLLFASI